MSANKETVDILRLLAIRMALFKWYQIALNPVEYSVLFFIVTCTRKGFRTSGVHLTVHSPYVNGTQSALAVKSCM